MHIGGKDLPYYKVLNNYINPRKGLGHQWRQLSAQLWLKTKEKKGRKLLGCITWGKELYKESLYNKIITQPHVVEYYAQYWSSHLRKNAVEMEKVQQTNDKNIKVMINSHAKNMIKGRIRGSKIPVYRVRKGKEREWEHNYSLSHTKPNLKDVKYTNK